MKIVPICLLCMLSAFAQLSSAQSESTAVPEANPGRPTVSTPATLTPVGYLQFENGALFAEDSAEFSKRFGIEQVQGDVRRAQFGQTLSISHSLGKFTISGEVWHFSQPFEKGNTVGNLWAVSRALRKNLVVDAGFNRGLTNTSTRWEAFVGFTYLLPHRLWAGPHGFQP